MPRVLTTAQARSILAQETAEVFLPCLTIQSGDQAFRIVNNTEPVVRAAGTFQPYPFTPDFPEDSDEQGGTVTVSVDNIVRNNNLYTSLTANDNAANTFISENLVGASFA